MAGAPMADKPPRRHSPLYSELANSRLAEPVDVKCRGVRRTGSFFVSSKALLASSPTSHPPRRSNHRA